MTEAEFQNAVVKLARTCGWRVAHFRPAMMKSGAWATPLQGDAGFPDLVMVGHGRVLFRELKVGKNKPSDEQLRWGEALTMAGADWCVWREKDWPVEVQRDLQ